MKKQKWFVEIQPRVQLTPHTGLSARREKIVLFSFAVALVLGTAALTDLQAQQPKPKAVSTQNAKVVVSETSRSANGQDDSALVKRIALFPDSSSLPEAEAKTYEDTRNLLLKMESGTYDHALRELFVIGDERIQDLVSALNDPNRSVKLNAQIAIRYLGNEVGMRALIEYYKNALRYDLVGPVPLPLRNWDYEYIKLHYLRPSVEWDGRTALYIYALALDESTEARTLLRDLMAKARAGSIPPNYALIRVAALRSDSTMLDDATLKTAIVEKAFFLTLEDRQQAEAKIVSFTRSKDKALVELNTSAGALPLERYHIVLNRRGKYWRFYSITRISVS